MQLLGSTPNSTMPSRTGRSAKKNKAQLLAGSRDEALSLPKGIRLGKKKHHTVSLAPHDLRTSLSAREDPRNSIPISLPGPRQAYRRLHDPKLRPTEALAVLPSHSHGVGSKRRHFQTPELRILRTTRGEAT